MMNFMVTVDVNSLVMSLLSRHIETHVPDPSLNSFFSIIGQEVLVQLVLTSANCSPLLHFLGFVTASE